MIINEINKELFMFVIGVGFDLFVRVLFLLFVKKNDINIYFCCF